MIKGHCLTQKKKKLQRSTAGQETYYLLLKHIYKKGVYLLRSHVGCGADTVTHVCCWHARGSCSSEFEVREPFTLCLCGCGELITPTLSFGAVIKGAGGWFTQAFFTATSSSSLWGRWHPFLSLDSRIWDRKYLLVSDMSLFFFLSKHIIRPSRIISRQDETQNRVRPLI